MAIGEIRNAAENPQMSGYDVVSRQIEHRVRWNVSRCRADGLIAVLEILRSHGIYYQTDLVDIVLSSRDSRFEHPVRCIGRDLPCLAGDDAARKASIQQARIGKYIEVFARIHRRDQAKQIVVTFELHPATAGITRVDIDRLGLGELFSLNAVFDVDLKQTDVVVKPQDRPAVHTQLRKSGIWSGPDCWSGRNY